MKKLTILMSLIFYFILSGTLISQTVSTRNSYVSTDKGVIRALVLFAEVVYAPTPCADVCGAWDDNWDIVDGVTQVPAWADDMFDSDLDPGELPTKYLSKYYYEASFGEYTILGDYYDKVLQVPCTGLYCGADGASDTWLSLALQASQTTKHGYSLSDFDKWDLDGETETTLKGNPKTLGSDDLVDLLIIIWRNNQYVTSQENGVGGFGTHIHNYHLPCGDVDGYNDVTSYCVGTNSFLDACGVTITEHVHALFGGNNWHSAGGEGLRTFLSIPASYGITGQSAAASKRVCGWDRNTLGWENPSKNQLDGNYISCGDGLAEVLSDVSIQNYPNGGEFILRDHNITGDAVRVKIPHLNWVTNGDTKNQYMWFENRQMISDFDDQWYYSSGCQTQTPGLFAYLQVGKDLVEGVSSTIYPNESPSDNPNSLGTYLFPLTAEGNFDFALDLSNTPPLGGTCDWSNNSFIVLMDECLSNSFTGFSDLFKENLDGGDGILNNADDLFFGRYKKYGAGTPINSVFDFGDDKDAFTLSGNKKISIGTNPASTPVYTYRSHPYSAAYPNTMGTYENRTIYLNGFSMEILDEISTTIIYNGVSQSTKNVKIKIRWDDYSVNNDVRWCGNIVLENDINDPLARQSQIILEAGKTISLDRGLSPTQHIAEEMIDGVWYFSEPTVLTLKNGTKSTLKIGSSLIVEQGSTLHLESGSELIIEQDAKLLVQDHGIIILDPGASIKCTQSGAKITVDADGILIMNGNDIQLNNIATQIELKANGIIQTADNVNFTFTGTGYLYYYQNGIFNLGLNSKFILQGSANTDKKMWVGTNALLYIAGHDVELNDCRLEYSSGSTFKMSDNSVTFDNVYVNDGAQTAGHAIHAYNTDDLLVNSCDFSGFNSAILLEDIDVCPNDVNVNINYSTFTNHNFAAIEAYNIDRMQLFSSTATAKNSSVTAGVFLVDVAECTIHGGSIKQYAKNSVDAAGIFAKNVGALIIDGSSIRNNYDGIESRATNIYVRNGAAIKLNTNGINFLSAAEPTETPVLLCRLTVGDIGCGWIITNTNGVIGEDVFLDIDQQIHANASDNPFDIHPNRFDGNTSKAFDICYTHYTNVEISNPIPASHNYWTSGAAPSTANYDIGFSTDPHCDDITLITSYYYTTQPTTCNCILSDCGTSPTDENVQLRLSGTSCNYTIPRQGGGTISIANQYRDAYMYFANGDFNYSYPKFNWLNNKVNSQYPNGLPDGVCKQLHQSSAKLLPIADLLATVHCQYPFWQEERIFDEDTEYSNLFQIYPNPSQTVVTFSSFDVPNAIYKIFSITGEFIDEGRFDGGITINTRDYPKGMFIVQFYNNNNELLETQKIITQ